MPRREDASPDARPAAPWLFMVLIAPFGVITGVLTVTLDKMAS